VHSRHLTRALMAAAALGLAGVGSAAALPTAGASPVAASNAGNPMAGAAREALDALWARALSTLQPDTWSSFAGTDPALTVIADRWTLARRQVANLVAERATVDPAELDGVWQQTSDQRMVVVLTALTQVGVPYHRNAASPDRALDCSGLTQYAWSAAGVWLPHQSGGQIATSDLQSHDEAEPGDLAWYPGHVMLYLGVGDAIVHAPHTGARVEVRDASRIRKLGSPI
jgi:cell wall-associated NlpC family hydrolase